ncbi:TetR/AcrR family transcriptional regulator [Streptomyces sp. N2-109]|uniref:TetR/AcrR family transcriptional regulator n=1 Tax=Streptomyces gossypii TaxID=2883101 RepID=A0ABT2JSC4_9ACTN|nr:TetR/AcrR family transcriptional regulator [Streptomyces gossypii]MCT2590389.1 TetR/AcrR family transcriptional regulator [Streptomyces gossypii]
MSGVRKERADAVRNREAVLAAAARLFADHGGPERVSMDDIAQAAGVGKGTLFRRFGDRTGLVRALVEQRTERLRAQVVSGPPPLGPGARPDVRVLAVLDALLRFKLDNRPLMLALENADVGSPYQNEAYELWHAQLMALLAEVRGHRDADFLAHALLAAVRSDLIEHLVRAGKSPGELCEGTAALVRAVLGGADSPEAGKVEEKGEAG